MKKKKCSAPVSRYGGELGVCFCFTSVEYCKRFAKKSSSPPLRSGPLSFLWDVCFCTSFYHYAYIVYCSSLALGSAENFRMSLFLSFGLGAWWLWWFFIIHDRLHWAEYMYFSVFAERWGGCVSVCTYVYIHMFIYKCMYIYIYI